MSNSSHRRKKSNVRTLEPLNAYDRDKRMWEIRNSYSHGRRPPQPRTKHELDILKERHQFVRSSEVDPSTLSWEDQLASKYYDSLFKEFAIVNLKHWRTGQIGLRWRTEDEVLSGIGHLTCASMRCSYHSPDPRIVAERQLAEEDEPLVVDPESSLPLVKTALEESEMNFGYMEEGEKKTTLVKVVLCRDCGKKLRRGREKAKEERERALSGGSTGGDQLSRPREASGREGSERRRSRGNEIDEEKHRVRRRSRSRSRDAQHSDEDEAQQEEEDYTPSLPPDLERARSNFSRQSPSHGTSRSRRRSASPASRHR
ncbi:hypothetical protein JCM5350_001184 [Sporobolomyces pararoseus]